MKTDQPVLFESIAALHRAVGQPAPLHPLVSIVNYGEVGGDLSHLANGMIMSFYKISFKTRFRGRIRYGQGYYDFEAGGMSFIAPGQLIRGVDEEADYEGMSLHVHPDLLRPYALGKAIRNYGFFSYTAAEALYVSEKEKQTILTVFDHIQNELNERIDSFSQDVIVNQIELLLNYSNRFYNRQFITRRAVNSDVLARFEELLEVYFQDEKTLMTGLPTVQYLADQLTLSPRYLSDLLRSLTGQNTQQHIHNKVIERAKQYLVADQLTVAEVAYQLGFEHPQSFNKIFKKKTSLTPLEFRQTFKG